MQPASSKPYLVRALYEWCVDCGYTPHLLVHVDENTRVPTQFIQKGEIILNISPDATHQLQIGNDWVEFNARFGGVPYKIEIPIGNVLAIYAHESAEGIRFPLSPLNATSDAENPTEAKPVATLQSGKQNPQTPSKPDEKKGSHLKIIK